MKRPPHPLEEALQARVRLLATTLRPATVRHYNQTVRLFMAFLRDAFPDVRRAAQLRRDPHLLGWLEHLWMQRVHHSGKPLCNQTRAAHLIRLRKLFDLLADHPFPPRPGLLLSEDIPSPDQVLPRPLTPEDDTRLQTELQRRNDLLSNALLLTRLTGLRIGETIDLSADCLRHLGGEDWALHVPVGKLHNERWTPVDQQGRSLVARLRHSGGDRCAHRATPASTYLRHFHVARRRQLARPHETARPSHRQHDPALRRDHTERSSA